MTSFNIKSHIDWEKAKLLEPTKEQERLLIFIYEYGKERPKIIEGDKVKVFVKAYEKPFLEKLMKTIKRRKK